jgi:steroid delta-isomerase
LRPLPEYGFFFSGQRMHQEGAETPARLFMAAMRADDPGGPRQAVHRVTAEFVHLIRPQALPIAATFNPHKRPPWSGNGANLALQYARFDPPKQRQQNRCGTAILIVLKNEASLNAIERKEAVMHSLELCKTYLAALGRGDLAGVLALFEPGATVSSPLYGNLDAKSYYERLIADTDTERTIPRLLSVFEALKEQPCIGLHFHYTWVRKSAGTVEFEGFNIYDMTSDGHRFKHVTIICDTAPMLKRSTKS